MDVLPYRYSADGLAPYTCLAATTCCPTDPCWLDKCALTCSFIDQLPTGPIWDRHKAAWLDHMRNNGVLPCEPAACSGYSCVDQSCYTMVNHAAYTAARLYQAVTEALMPAFRESNPHTATTTVDDWLTRLGWYDCFRTACSYTRGLGSNPYAVYHDGKILDTCALDMGTALECAVKHNIIRSLTRLRMGIIKNLDSINWVLEPLSAKIEPYYPPDIDGRDCPVVDCERVRFQICQTGTTIDACPSQNCIDRVPDANHCFEPAAEQVDAYYVPDQCTDPAGLPGVIWPALLAAECIATTMLPDHCDKILYRCPCEIPT